MSNQYTRKDIEKRQQRAERHKERALQEHSKNICQMPFIDKVDVFYFSGKPDEIKDEFIIHFHLKNPVLFNDFKELILNKLRGAIIE